MKQEPLKYLENEDDIYLDKKPVREAFGTVYLAILEALNLALLKKGLLKKELPKSVEGYMTAIKKYLSVNNGKLIREFDSLYDSVHIAGYYRGLLYDTDVVKDVIKSAENFIKKLI